MNTKRFVILILILILSLVCLLNCSASLYPEGTFDFTTLATKRTLEAPHIIVGEVTHVSFVFEREEYAPSSLVTVRVDKDIKGDIERADNQETNPPQRQASGEEGETPPQTITFVQTGGPWHDGGWVKAQGIRLLKKGDYVFIRLAPTAQPVRHNGQTVNSCTAEYGTTYSVEEKGDGIDEHIIKRSWQRLDMTVLEMTRIVRTTLKQPERMRTLERRVSKLKRPNFIDIDAGKAPDPRLPVVMNEVKAIEAELELPLLEEQ